MSDNDVAKSPWEQLALQPRDLSRSSDFERRTLIISVAQIDLNWVILSYYRDDVWLLDGFASNVCESKRRLDFGSVPAPFRAAVKAVMYRYLRRGRAGQQLPAGTTAIRFFSYVLPFLRHLDALKLKRLGVVTPLHCATYVTASRTYRQSHRRKGIPLSQGSLQARFQAVEALYELSQHTDDPIPHHPWTDSSAASMAGLIGISRLSCKTPLMPDAVFSTLFERAYEYVEQGKALLDLRDILAGVAAKRRGQNPHTIIEAKNCRLAALGREGGLSLFNQAILDLRTACYVVLASTSGCRNHELANVQSGAHHRTEDEMGTVYHWLRSKSEKTDAGWHDWMIPEAAVRALRLMERWAEPYQAMIAAEMAELRRVNPRDPQIRQAQEHRHALFLGVATKKGNQVRTLSGPAWNDSLKAFAHGCGLDWNLTSHQFRRKFANYAAHSQFGDLRYLKQHYAHWSMDMTLGYAMDQSWGRHLDNDLYIDIHAELEDIKLGVVNTWLSDELLAGGYGRSIKIWQRDPENLAIFKSHAAMLSSIAESSAIRSNGHAWCTAGDDRCVGNTLERTRCGTCTNAVIGLGHAAIYQRLYDNLKDLLDCKDIGEGGRQRVLRDLARCHEVLIQLGYDPEPNVA